MPSFQEHINQAKHNIEFLKLSNIHSNNYWDWQVTICFYCGLHLVNAHIANIANLHYRKHEEVNSSLNPENSLSPCKVPENVYLAYMKLQNLARRARYLVHDDKKNVSTHVFFTYDKHFNKAIRHLDTLMCFMEDIYSVDFEPIKINCLEFNGNDVTYFHKS